MLRWLGIILAIGLVSTSADAQVFKPKAKKAAATKPAKGEPKKAKKQPRTAPTKKRVATKKKAKAAKRDSAEDETSESESKGTDKDYVKIWDDDSIE